MLHLDVAEADRLTSQPDPHPAPFPLLPCLLTPLPSSQTDKYVAASRLRLRELEIALKISKREMRRARKTIKTYEMVAALNGGRLGDVPPSGAAAAAAPAVAPLTQADVSTAVAFALQQQAAASAAAAVAASRSVAAPAAIVAMVGDGAAGRMLVLGGASNACRGTSRVSSGCLLAMLMSPKLCVSQHTHMLLSFDSEQADETRNACDSMLKQV